MSSPNQPQTPTHFTSVLSSKSLDQQYIASHARGRPRGSLTGAKRGRKPRGAGISGSLSPRLFVPNTFSTTPTVPSIPTTPNIPSIPASSSQPLDLSGLLSLSQATPVYRPQMVPPSRPGHALDEDVEGEDELLPAMADDDYSAQLSWQSQSKDNLK